MARTQSVPSAQLQRLSNISWPVVRPASYKGRYTWRHNQVLKSLAAALESKRNTTNSVPPESKPYSITAPNLHPRGQKKAQSSPYQPEAGQLAMARDWKMLVDIGQQLIFPPEIAATTLGQTWYSGPLHWSRFTSQSSHSHGEEFNRRGLWAPKTALHRTGSRRSTTEDGKAKVYPVLKWDVEVLWLLPPSDCWKTLASMDRLCDRQLDQSLKQPKEAASGYGLSGRTIAGLKEHQHDPLTNPPHPLPYLRTQVTTLQEEGEQGMRSALCLTQGKEREGKWCVAKYGDPYSEFVLCI